MAQFLETDTSANIDISTAVSVGAYTATATRLLHVRVTADQVAGGGDYIIYATIQRAGAGSHYRFISTTTGTAAAALASIAFVSIGVPVVSGDVVTVWLDGLAGDNVTPDVNVDWFESDYVTGIANDAITAAAIAASADTEVAAAVWAYTPRTLTMTAAAIAAAIAGSLVTIHRGDSLSCAITGLGNIAARSKLWFTVKDNYDDPDTAAIIQIEETGGLLYLNGAAGVAIQGDITVDDAVAGDITVTMDEASTDDLVPTSGLYWDVQMLTAGGTVTTLAIGPCNISSDVTRTVA